MPASNDERLKKFREFNPYAAAVPDNDDADDRQLLATLAVAYELKQVQGAIRFARNGK